MLFHHVMFQSTRIIAISSTWLSWASFGRKLQHRQIGNNPEIKENKKAAAFTFGSVLVHRPAFCLLLAFSSLVRVLLRLLLLPTCATNPACDRNQQNKWEGSFFVKLYRAPDCKTQRVKWLGSRTSRSQERDAKGVDDCTL